MINLLPERVAIEAPPPSPTHRPAPRGHRTHIKEERQRLAPILNAPIVHCSTRINGHGKIVRTGIVRIGHTFLRVADPKRPLDDPAVTALQKLASDPQGS